MTFVNAKASFDAPIFDTKLNLKLYSGRAYSNLECVAAFIFAKKAVEDENEINTGK